MDAKSQKTLSKEDFISKTLELLNLERETEKEENSALLENVPLKELQRRGVCLLNLKVGSQRTGLFGRTLITFEPQWPGQEMPSHNLSPGDILALSLSSDPEVKGTGLVTQVRQKSITVAFEEKDNVEINDDVKYKLVKLTNDVTYKRLRHALNDLNRERQGTCGQLIEVLFNETARTSPYNTCNDIVFFNQGLDESQQKAAKFALQQAEVAIIHGPPGTGKTTTVIEIIQQAVKLKRKILACAPSNVAVDNLVERLINKNIRIVRLGHPARAMQSIQKYSLDAILCNSEETQLVEDVRKDIDKSLTKLKKARNKDEKFRIRKDIKEFRKELRQREQVATKEVLSKADVILSTLTSGNSDGPLRHLDAKHFDVVIIDEVSQAMEVACWIALQNGPRCILAGDHKQLPPTIISKKAAAGGLELTLMERILKEQGDEMMQMLVTQYRMNENIMKWASDALYDGKLVAHHSVAKHLLRDLPEVEDNDVTSIPLLLIDTAGCNLPELDVPENVSKGNEGEADLVQIHVEKLIKSGLKCEDIAVIAPYNLQVDLLRLRLSQKYPKLEIKSVDAFQGREKEAVVFTLVRSNDRGEVGFLSEDRRLNVAITRARRHVAVICDSGTVSHHGFLKGLVDYLSENGEVHSAHLYQQDFDIGTPSNYKSNQASQVKSKKKKNKQTYQPKNKENTNLDGKSNLVGKSGAETDAKPKRTEAEEKALRDGIEKIIKVFLNNTDETEYSFKPTLNSYERMIVHEFAEKYKLIHESCGEGKDRYIVIKKKNEVKLSEAISADDGKGATSVAISSDKNGPTVAIAGAPEPLAVFSASDLPINDGIDDEDDELEVITMSSVLSDDLDSDIDVELGKPIKVDVSMNNQRTESEIAPNYIEFRECNICGKDIPKLNYTIHILRCQLHNLPQEDPKKEQEHGSQKGKKKKKNKNKCVPNKLEKVDGDDFDALMAMAETMDKVCNFVKCKERVTSSNCGQQCQFCRRMFCLKHHIPEVHGCGADAKTRARQIIIRDGIIHRGSGTPNKKPDPTKRAHLQRRLEKVINEKHDQRKGQK